MRLSSLWREHIHLLGRLKVIEFVAITAYCRLACNLTTVESQLCALCDFIGAIPVAVMLYWDERFGRFKLRRALTEKP